MLLSLDTLSVVCFFHTTSLKTDAARISPSSADRCATLSPGNSFILGWKGRRSR